MHCAAGVRWLGATLLPVGEDLYSEDIQTSLAALNRGVEAIVALAPEQYQWEYKRFRDRPPGVSAAYD